MLSIYDLSRRGVLIVYPITCYKKCSSQYAYDKQIALWLVRLSDFYSLVAMNHNS